MDRAGKCHVIVTVTSVQCVVCVMSAFHCSHACMHARARLAALSSMEFLSLLLMMMMSSVGWIAGVGVGVRAWQYIGAALFARGCMCSLDISSDESPFFVEVWFALTLTFEVGGVVGVRGGVPEGSGVQR